MIYPTRYHLSLQALPATPASTAEPYYFYLQEITFSGLGSSLWLNQTLCNKNLSSGWVWFPSGAVGWKLPGTCGFSYSYSQGSAIFLQSNVAQQPQGNLSNFFGDVLVKLIAVFASGNFNGTPLFHDNLKIPREMRAKMDASSGTFFLFSWFILPSECRSA